MCAIGITLEHPPIVLHKDGKEVELTSYKIKGNSYIKLRDLGASFDFGVEWDAKTKNVRSNASSSYVE